MREYCVFLYTRFVCLFIHLHLRCPHVAPPVGENYKTAKNVKRKHKTQTYAGGDTNNKQDRNTCNNVRLLTGLLPKQCICMRTCGAASRQRDIIFLIPSAARCGRARGFPGCYFPFVLGFDSTTSSLVICIPRESTLLACHPFHTNICMYLCMYIRYGANFHIKNRWPASSGRSKEICRDRWALVEGGVEKGGRGNQTQYWKIRLFHVIDSTPTPE